MRPGQGSRPELKCSRSRAVRPISWSSVGRSPRTTFVLIEDYAYPAYGVLSAETNDAIRLAARMEGMMTDPVYEGTSMQGMIDLVRKGYFPAGSRVLYAHLGGVPAINAYSYIYRNG